MSWQGALEFTSTVIPGKTWRLTKTRILGKGSFGLAVLAQDAADAAHPIVVKEVCLQMCKDEKELASIFGEIKILKAVKHPNVVQFIDSYFVESSQMLYILMEYCDGGDLGQLITRWQRQGGAPERDVTSLLIQMLMALKCLHMEHRIIHRDLKPQNIFLTSEGVVKIGDFGVSTVLSSTADFAQTFCGSPYYLAPELCEEKHYNGKADLWSLGCILYEMLAAGERPFRGKTLMSLVQQIIQCNYVPIEQQTEGHQPPYSGDLLRIVSLLLKKQPEERASIFRLLRLTNIHRAAPQVLPLSLLEMEDYKEQFRGKSHRPLGIDSSMAVSAQRSDMFRSSAAVVVASAGGGAPRSPPPMPLVSSVTLPMSAAGIGGMPPSGGTMAPRDEEATPYDDDEFENFDDEDDIEARVYASWSVHRPVSLGATMA